MGQKDKQTVNRNIYKKRGREGMVESTSLGGHAANLLLGIILLLVAFCSIVPVWHVVMASISNGRSLFSQEGLVLWPSGGFNLEGYRMVFSDNTILRSYAVTIFYVVATAGLGLLLNVLGGYVLSQQSKLKPFFVGLLMFSIMFNGGLIPTYMVIQNLGMVGTPLAVIIPGCTNAMYVVMAMNSFLQVPQATVEAAKIDGAGHGNLMFHVMLPQAKGLIMVTVINTALTAWNAWFEASIYLPRQRQWWPLQLIIRDLTARNQDFLNYPNPDYNRYLIQYVVIVIATLPILLTFPLFQKRLEDNMVVGAVKG